MTHPARRLKSLERPPLFKAQGQRLDAPLVAALKAGSITDAAFSANGLADDELGPGEFIAVASVFGNVDSYGERMVEGAFTDTLAAWKASGDPIPVIYAHDWGNPDAHIGEVLAIAQIPTVGLVYKGRTDVEDNPFAARVYKLMKGRRITQQSFGFDILEGGYVEEDGRSIYEIRKVNLFEVGPCLVGVNQATQLLDAGKASSETPPATPADGLTATPTVAVTEPSGQATATAASVSSETEGSDPSTPASKALSPASLQLLISVNDFLEEIPA